MMLSKKLGKIVNEKNDKRIRVIKARKFLQLINEV